MWDGAKSLSRILFTLPIKSIKDKKVLELGCGAACLGSMVASKLGADSVIATDVPGEVCELAKSNIEANGIQRTVVEPLDWTWTEIPESIAAQAPYDLILASDTIFSLALVAPFLDKIIRLAHEKTVAYIAYEERDPIVVAAFLEKARESLEVVKVPRASKYRGDGEADVVIAKLKLKKETQQRLAGLQPMTRTDSAKGSPKIPPNHTV